MPRPFYGRASKLLICPQIQFTNMGSRRSSDKNILSKDKALLSVVVVSHFYNATTRLLTKLQHKNNNETIQDLIWLMVVNYRTLWVELMVMYQDIFCLNCIAN